jgi:hypothetical protein
MDVSRRKFLGAFSASVAAILSIGSRAEGGSRSFGLLRRAAPEKMPADALSQLGWNSFNQNLYTDFEFSSLQAGRNSSRPARLRLVSIKDEDNLRKGAPGNESRCFVLTFSQSSRSQRLMQGTYAVNHFALGAFELFISDAGVADSGFTYTAVINRILG